MDHPTPPWANLVGVPATAPSRLPRRPRRVGSETTHRRNENRLFRRMIEAGVPREVAERKRAQLAAKHDAQRAAAARAELPEAS
jgi:hypothetical protein